MTPTTTWKRWLADWLASWRVADTATTTKASPVVEATSQQRQRRNSRREALYAVVREAMIRAGVLSSAYKFKVLTLDPDGLSHLVLIDVQSAAIHPVPGGQAALEKGLQQLARERSQLVVKSVYWRLLNDAPASSGKTKSPVASMSVPAATRSGHEEISHDEIVALREALAGQSNASRQTQPDFEPTMPMVRRPPRLDHPLSDTQMGELR